MSRWVDKAWDMPEAVQVSLGDIGAGVIDHNLMCWLCNERMAMYCMNPVWVFAPCEECQKKTDTSFDVLADAIYRERRRKRSVLTRLLNRLHLVTR